MRTPKECAEFMIYDRRSHAKALTDCEERVAHYLSMARIKPHPLDFSNEEIAERLAYWSLVLKALKAYKGMH